MVVYIWWKPLFAILVGEVIRTPIKIAEANCMIPGKNYDQGLSTVTFGVKSVFF